MQRKLQEFSDEEGSRNAILVRLALDDRCESAIGRVHQDVSTTLARALHEANLVLEILQLGALESVSEDLEPSIFEVVERQGVTPCIKGLLFARRVMKLGGFEGVLVVVEVLHAARVADGGGRGREEVRS